MNLRGGRQWMREEERGGGGRRREEGEEKVNERGKDRRKGRTGGRAESVMEICFMRWER